MPQPTNDKMLPFWVLVQSSQGSGPKFYSGAASLQDAQQLADRQNNAEVLRHGNREAERHSMAHEFEPKSRTVARYAYIACARDAGERAIGGQP